MRIFTTRQTKDLDSYTIAFEPISSINLMERASRVFVKTFKQRYPLSSCNKVVAIAGHGNNGGDALAIARLLSQDGYCVEAYLYYSGKELSIDCEENKRRLQETPSVLLKEDKAFTDFPTLSVGDVIIDGLFGSGLHTLLSPKYILLIKHLNESSAQIVSIDIPSGLFGEDNTHNNPEAVVCADFTLTFQFPKLSFLFAENEKHVGNWEVLDISLHPEILHSTETPYAMIERKEISRILKKRSKFAHKGFFGHALLIAGSSGKMGAAILSSRACLRSGVGLLTVSVPPCGIEILQVAVPEAMVCTSYNTDAYSFIGVGPGIGTEKETVVAFSSLLSSSKKPMVLDADALNIIALYPEMQEKIPKGSILTPHPKEFDRLAGASVSSFERLQKAMSFAMMTQSYLVLKGAYTAICTPAGKCFFNTTGNPGMATAGSGDVLTGMILSLLCQNYTSEEAALLGVYLHGMVADKTIHAGTQSQESLMSGDLVNSIGACFLELSGSPFTTDFE